MIKIILRDKKLAIILITTLIICSIAISVGIYAQITNAKIKVQNANVEKEEVTNLKDDFYNIFKNELNTNGNIEPMESDIKYDEIISLAYRIRETKSGDYSINANIPTFIKETKTTKEINKDINDLFISKMFTIAQSTKSYTIYTVDYIAYINYNILSLAIRSTLKDQTNPQRVSIKTYNYDIQNDKLLSIDEVLKIKKLKNETVQNKIDTEIEKISDEKNKINVDGYDLYKRDPQNKMYKLTNTETFFLGEKGYLYIIYAYGNKNFTSEIDTIIF